MCFLVACSSKAQKQTAAAQSSLAQQQIKTSNYGLTNLQGSLPGVLSFFQNLVSGDRNSIMNAIEPAVSSLTSQYEAGRVAENEFAPRGGGRTAADVSSQFDEAGKISGLVSEAQTAGATGLTQIDQLLTSLTEGSAIGASTTLGNLSTQLDNEQQTQQQAGASAGEGIGSLIALLAA